MKSDVKMCPKRKDTYPGIDGDGWNFTTEEFLPCIQEKCAWWDAKGDCVFLVAIRGGGAGQYGV
jgi:hypothetical protein